jgi:SAM-dependent methyltransferase
MFFAKLFSLFNQNNQKVKLAEGQLMPPAEVCSLCHSPLIRQVGYLQREPDVFLWECLHCRVAGASRLPQESALEEYYAKYYEDGKVWTTSSPESTVEHVFSKVKGQFNKPLRILDFGGGDGTVGIMLGQRFLLANRTPRVKVDLIDYNAKSREVPRGVDYCWHRELPPLDEEGYDIVLASAILEHLPKANEVLLCLLERVTHGGYFYGRTPFHLAFHKVTSYLGLPSPIPYPAHLYDMGRDYWDRVLSVLALDDKYHLLTSCTSLVETSLHSRRWPIAIVSHLFKAPSKLPILRNHYDFVGGWEVFIQRHHQSSKN